MSGTLMIFASQRSAYKWLRQCCVPHLCRNVIKDLHVHNTVQYSISVEDDNIHLSKIKAFKIKNVSDRNNLRTNNSLSNAIENLYRKGNSQNSIKRKIEIGMIPIYKDFVQQQYVDKQKEANNKMTSSERINKDILMHKRLERLYPEPKNSLLSIYTIVSNELHDQTVLTSNIKQAHKSRIWEFTYNIKWPTTMSFKAVGKTKGIASKSAALKCLQWLEMNGKLNYGKPIIYNREQIRNMKLKSTEISVTPEILNEMKDLIEIYNMKIRDIATEENTSDSMSYDTLDVAVPIHPIIGEITYTNIDARNEILKNRLLKRPALDISLPIFEFREEILSKLQKNRILLIEGDTGCGKTTQVPQFIMDSFAENGNATDCNILISQPRRISAISLADRIAYERNEMVGDVVGYHVRLEHTTPKEFGGILFCTTGILLKKLQYNPGLKGCSHVILDEAHERSVDTDMLMILLKRALKNNPDLKVLIMSATINSHLFKEYFNCPAVKIPGRLFPVQMNFLDDIERLPNIRKYKSIYNFYNSDENEKLLVDYEKIVQIIKWISEYKPHGAILCFLPGWSEITGVQKILENIPLDSEKQLILPMHSKISHREQRKIFECAPMGTRKIILATDIAETGITVSDVCYVIDSAIRKESRWDNDKDLARISNRWVSQANIQQRKGRAGRVKPGVSYHLITRAEYEKLEPYPVAQVLCTSLEKVVLDSKTYTNEKAEDFLAGLLESPSSMTIRKAVNYLINLGVMDDEENLTALGKRMTLFPTHPKFSKALVYSSIFNCIHPIITIASIFSNEDNLFYDVLNNKLEIRENKKLYHPSSDHIAMSWIYKQWYIHCLQNPHLVLKFCKQMKLRNVRMDIIKQIRETFVQQLMLCRLLPRNVTYDYNDSDIKANKYENNDELIRGLLYSATQQLIEHKDIGLKNGIMRTGANELRTQNQAKAVISGESVNYKRKVWLSPYSTYFHSAHCDVRRSTVIRETSMISPLTVLLFNQRKTHCREYEDGRTEILINTDKHTLRFSCDAETADILLKFKNIIWSMVQYSLEKQGITENTNDYKIKQMFQYKDQLLDTLVNALRISSKCMENEEDQ